MTKKIKPKVSQRIRIEREESNGSKYVRVSLETYTKISNHQTKMITKLGRHVTKLETCMDLIQ